ncbi:helix-turn-helix transcriptional regulator [Enterococcus sp.]|uniref:helix-turn-helix domain-containing protein n=1 Tax=Enterococcus sp. TaxID=35783 RepID=UPI002908C64B|nr:helix-turn-helix transcriptional regulator [Enterococcus sp.]MDU5335219.1 helix-turn-helix transcriptional regulator [Enterococcus sp.]
MKIGHKLKDLRTAHGYTQEELAAILNVSRSTISSWEINRTYPDLSMLVSLSELYEITLDQLINEDDKLVDTMTNETKKNSAFKKIILALFVLIISFTVVVIFLITNNNKLEEPKVLLYEFSDYAKYLKKDDDGDNTIYYYKDSFVEEISDTLPDGNKTSLSQPTVINSMYTKQVILKVKRDKNHEIEKVSVVDSKDTIELLEDQYGGNIQMVEYDSWDAAQVAIQEIEDSQVKENPKDGPVFLKSDDGTKVSAFFKTE